MRCIILGAGGYIGRHIVSALKQKGHHIIIPQASDGSRLNIAYPEALASVDWNVDAVFMFAGVTGAGISFDQYERFLHGNELLLLNVLDAIRSSSSRPRVIFPSSRLIYHGSELPLSENSPLETKTLYSANKIACENYLHAFSNAFDIPYTVLRICVPYANLLSQEYSYGTVGNFITQASKSGCIRLYGGGEVRRTFLHIEDLCNLTILAAEHQKTSNQTYNLPGENMSLYEAASLIAHRFGARVESMDWPELDARIESGSTVFDGSLILNTLHSEVSHRFSDWAALIPTVI